MAPLGSDTSTSYEVLHAKFPLMDYMQRPKLINAGLADPVGN